MSIETVARRYAAALADVVEKTGETETVKSELRAWEELINSNTDLRDAFGNPSIPHLRKDAVLNDLISRAKPSRTTANFLRVLLENGRLTEISEITARFESVLDERSDIVIGEVSSARALSDDQKAQIVGNLEKITGKRVKPTFEIKDDLIGGVVARIGSTVYDGSVRTQLENLREQLIDG